MDREELERFVQSELERLLRVQAETFISGPLDLLARRQLIEQAVTNLSIDIARRCLLCPDKDLLNMWKALRDMEDWLKLPIDGKGDITPVARVAEKDVQRMIELLTDDS